MEDFIPVLKHTRLSAGVGGEEIAAILACLHARAEDYRENEFVYRSGEHICAVSVLVKGSLLIQKDDYCKRLTICHSDPPEKS